MPKATLTFNLPEEQEEYETTMKASGYSCAIWEFDQRFLRANIKYGLSEELAQKILHELKGGYDEPLEVSPEILERVALETLEVVRTRFYEFLNEYNANPFE